MLLTKNTRLIQEWYFIVCMHVSERMFSNLEDEDCFHSLTKKPRAGLSRFVWQYEGEFY